MLDCLRFPLIGPYPAFSFDDNVDWDIHRNEERSNIWWESANPLLAVPGISNMNFYEDVMHSDGQGTRPIIAGGALVSMHDDTSIYSSECVCL